MTRQDAKDAMDNYVIVRASDGTTGLIIEVSVGRALVEHDFHHATWYDIRNLDKVDM